MSEIAYAPSATETQTAPLQERLIMIETDPLTIQVQIELGVVEFGSALNFTNNFKDNLPDGRRPKMMAMLKKLDTPRQNANTWSEWEERAHSELITTKTYGEFYADIADAKKRTTADPTSGFDSEEFGHLYAAVHRKDFSGNPNKDAIMEAYCTSMLPLYGMLRRDYGYTHYDLTQ